MRAQELRIGNYVWLWDNDFMDNEIISVFEINENELNGYKYRLTEAEPIPLTEEWLLRFGFEHRVSKKDDYYAKGGQCFCFLESKLAVEIYKHIPMYFYLPEKRTVFGTNNPILYVHQLQNLYFALTGEELTIDKQPSL